jgi:hypothetical protein
VHTCEAQNTPSPGFDDVRVITDASASGARTVGDGRCCAARFGGYGRTEPIPTCGWPQQTGYVKMSLVAVLRSLR